MIAPLILLLVVVAWVAWRKREEVVVKDSPEFVEALKIWLPVITAKQNTPRSVKRFLNRVRYLAMLQRPREETHISTNGIFSRVFQTNGTAQANRTAAQEKKVIPESLLVALSAVQLTYPEWIEKNSSFTTNASERIQTDDELYELYQVTAAHNQKFHNLKMADSYWSAFVEMSKGIRVQS